MAELIPLRETEDIFTSRNRLNLRAAAYFRDITLMVNTSTNEVGEINTQLAQNLQNSARINELEKRKVRTRPTTVSITAKAFETVICNNVVPITITTPINPIEEDVFTVKRKDAKVTILGPIDGEVRKIINRKNAAPKLVFSGVEWAII